MGLAAPQIGIRRAAAAVQPPDDGAGAIVSLDREAEQAAGGPDGPYECQP